MSEHTMKERTVDFLRKVALFAGLGDSELTGLSNLLMEISAQRGEIILLEGDAGRPMYLVASGTVKVYKSSGDGREQILRLARPGEAFNHICFFDGGPSYANAQAMEQSLLYAIRPVDLEAALHRHPQIARNANRVLAQEVRLLASLVEDLSFRHVIARVAKILLEYAADGSGSRLRLTQQEMAALAGTAREVIGRSLKALEEGGAIRMDRHRIVVRDKEALRNMAGQAV